MRKSNDSFRYKAIDYRIMIVFFLIVAILVYKVGATLPQRIFFGLLGFASVYWLNKWSKDLQLFLPSNKPYYALGNDIEEMCSLQIHTCLSKFFPVKFLRVDTRLFIIMNTYKNPFENNPKAIQKLKNEIIYLKDYILEYDLGKKNFLDSVANGINFLFWLLLLVSIVAIALLLF